MKEKIQGIFESLVGMLKGTFSPILPAITAAGMLKGVNILLELLSIITQDTSTYTILSGISDTVFYFLPVLIAISAAMNVFKVSPYISAAVVLVLFYPDITSLFTSGTSTELFGLPVYEADYSSSVIPAILVVWIQSYVEPFAYRIMPDLLEDIFSPALTVLVMSALALVVLGPIGQGFGLLLGGFLQWLGSIASWLVPTVLGGFGIFFVITGGHYTLFPIMFNQIGTQGYENFFAAGMLATNLALAGAVLGTLVKIKNKRYRSYAFSTFITSVLGISQPGIYGVALQFRRALVGSILGGLVGGFIGGITNFVAYAYVNPGLAALPVYMSPDGSWANIIKAFVIMAVSLGVAFIYVYMGDFEDVSDEDIARIQADSENQNVSESEDNGKEENTEVNKNDRSENSKQQGQTVTLE